MDAETTRTIVHQCSLDNQECVTFMRNFSGTNGDYPYKNIRDDQCCLCYFSGEECHDPSD
jgi:hypothetical protein